MRIVRHDGAVEVVVALPLVYVVGHIGVKNCVCLFVYQRFDMSVNEFRGVTYRVGRYGVLTDFVNFSVRKRRSHRIESEFGEKLAPKG